MKLLFVFRNNNYIVVMVSATSPFCNRTRGCTAANDISCASEFLKKRMFKKRGCNIKTVLFREKKKLLCNSKYHADMMHRSTVI